MNPHEIGVFFLSLGLLLAAARLLGEVAQRLRQPAFVGELLAGVLLGPTAAGRLFPELTSRFFSAGGANVAAWDSLTMLSIVLLLLVIGMQVQLSTVWRTHHTSFAILGFIVPFATALAAAWAIPYILGCERDADPIIFALFFGTAMSISAPSVITRTLVDLDLYGSDFGRLTIASAVFNNLMAWIIFGAILGLLDDGVNGYWHVATTVSLTLVFALLVVTVGRYLVNRALPWIQAHTSWPGGVLGFAISLALIAAGLTEWLGIHAIFGAFLVGIAVGDSPRLRPEARRMILDFISSTFAPLFFASIGMRVDFFAKFDPIVVGSIVSIAFLGKLVGCGLTARLTGYRWNESSAVGFAMNARGAMATILGFLAMQNGLIRQRMFVALVITAIATSMLSEPVIKRLLGRKRSVSFPDFIPPTGFRPALENRVRWMVLEELANELRTSASNSLLSDSALWGGDVRIEWAGPNQEVAVCLVGMEDIQVPIIAIGVSPQGIDFGRLAEAPVYVVLLVVTPSGDLDSELVLEEDIQKAFANERTVHEVRRATSLAEFKIALKACERTAIQDKPVEVPMA